jgi:hypothetical protein
MRMIKLWGFKKYNVGNTKGNLKMEKDVGRDNFIGITDNTMKDNGKMVESMVMAIGEQNTVKVIQVSGIMDW